MVGRATGRTELAIRSFQRSLALYEALPQHHFQLGCALFEAICALPQYYPTRTERAILTAHRDEIVRATGTRKQLVDLGAGDCTKAALLLPAAQPRRYVAVDIAASAIRPALLRMAQAFPGVELFGVVTDFTFRLHPVGKLLAGQLVYRVDDAVAVLSKWRGLMTSAPDELACFGFVARSSMTSFDTAARSTWTCRERPSVCDSAEERTSS